MSDQKRMAEELLEHLRLYRDLGVKWVERPSAKPDSRRKQPPAEPVVPAGVIPAAATRLQPAKIIPPVASMFDTLPEKHEELEAIRAELGDCQRCKLSRSRTNIVFGAGNPAADLMFVGEAPGASEDEQGLPFVGRAGQLLTKIIESIDMKREQVYICNILKCRPPDNRNPESDEIATCEPFLFRQIASVRPKVICALGTFGAQTLLRTKEPISRLRGQFIDYRGAKLIATFHPAYLLRNPGEKRRVWEDVQKIRDYLRSMGSSGS
jgi:uracil-DNA glycosylase family 4